MKYSAPGPPSSQSPSLAYLHVSVQPFQGGDGDGDGDGGDGGGDGGSGGVGGGGGELKHASASMSLSWPARRNFFVVMLLRPLITPSVAEHSRNSVTSFELRLGLAARMIAVAPATCGQAIEVPEMVLVAVVLVGHAALMLDPGAWMSTQEPQFEKLDLASLLMVEPTVIALGADAGE